MRDWQSLLVATALLPNLGCSKEPSVKCGDGTVLKDGVCVVATATSAAPSATAPKPKIKCGDTCKKVAECRGLNAEAPMVQAGCNTRCTQVSEATDEARDAYLLCVEQANCKSLSKCDTALLEATTPEIRKAKADDPVKVTKHSIADDRFGIAKELSLIYKNTSEKVIDGVKLHYFCTNNFDEPVGHGKLIAQDKIKPGEGDKGVWKIHEDNCTKVKVTVTDVHYVDGEKWIAE